MITSQQLADIGINPAQYNALSDDEKKVVEQVLFEISSGEKNSKTYESLYEADYSEIPVDFITFISDDRYLGKSTRNGQFLYPFWRKEIDKIFREYNSGTVNEVALSGSIGVGKSTAAVLAMIYHLYRMMCMKDPQSYFGLAPGTEIVYAFLNNTMASSYGVAYQAFQAFIQESPWFLKHGTITGRSYPEYVPDQGFKFVVGSKPQHTLGLAVICLFGDTQVITSQGIFKIEDLEGQVITVPCLSHDRSVTASQECTVQCTGVVTELVEIELEDGTIIKCTPSHRLMLKDGTYRMAKDLSDSDELLDIDVNSLGSSGVMT